MLQTSGVRSKTEAASRPWGARLSPGPCSPTCPGYQGAGPVAAPSLPGTDPIALNFLLGVKKQNKTIVIHTLVLRNEGIQRCVGYYPSFPLHFIPPLRK